MILDDAQYQEQKARFSKTLDYWWDALDLNRSGFTLKTDYQREENNHEEGSVYWRTFMNISTSWRYQSARMNVWLPEIYHLDDYELEENLVHELMHMLVNEIRDDPKIGAGSPPDSEELHDHEERVVTSLARSMVHLRGFSGGASPLAVSPVVLSDTPDPTVPILPNMPATDLARLLDPPDHKGSIPVVLNPNFDTSHGIQQPIEAPRDDSMIAVALED